MIPKSPVKTVQYFTEEYLEKSRTFTPEQVIEFLENYRQLVGMVHLSQNLPKKGSE